ERARSIEGRAEEVERVRERDAEPVEAEKVAAVEPDVADEARLAREVVVVEIVVGAVAEVVPEMGLLLQRERGGEHATGEEAEEGSGVWGRGVDGLGEEGGRGGGDGGGCDGGGKREAPWGGAGEPEERGGGGGGGGEEEPVEALGHPCHPER